MLHTATHQLIGVEALIRWDDEALNDRPLSESLLIAKEKDCFYDLGKNMIEQAFEEYKFIAKNKEGIRLSINTSIQQVKNPSFSTLVQLYLINIKSTLKLSILKSLKLPF